MPDDLDDPRGPQGPGWPGAKRRQQMVVPGVRPMHIHDSFFSPIGHRGKEEVSTVGRNARRDALRTARRTHRDTTRRILIAIFGTSARRPFRQPTVSKRAAVSVCFYHV